MDLKPQDLLFLTVFFLLLFKRDAKLFALAGVIFLIASIPLFSKWVFFTAQRLTWFAFLFFATSMILNIFKLKNK